MMTHSCLAGNLIIDNLQHLQDQHPLIWCRDCDKNEERNAYNMFRMVQRNLIFYAVRGLMSDKGFHLGSHKMERAQALGVVQAPRSAKADVYFCD